MTDEGLQQLNKAVADIWRESMDQHSKEKSFDNIAKKLIDEGKFPYILYKVYNRWYRYKPLLNRYLEYIKPHTFHWTSVTNGEKGKTKKGACIRILSDIYHEGDIKVITPKLWKKVKALDDQIKELEQKRTNLFKANFNKLPKLTLRRAREVTNFKNEILKKLGLIKEE